MQRKPQPAYLWDGARKIYMNKTNAEEINFDWLPKQNMFSNSAFSLCVFSYIYSAGMVIHSKILEIDCKIQTTVFTFFRYQSGKCNNKLPSSGTLNDLQNYFRSKRGNDFFTKKIWLESISNLAICCKVHGPRTPHVDETSDFFSLRIPFSGGKCWTWFAHLSLNRHLVLSCWKHNFHLLFERNIPNKLIARYFRIQCTIFVWYFSFKY